MTALGASYRNELEKLVRRKKYLVFLILGLAVCLLLNLLGRALTGFISSQGGLVFSLTPTPMGTLPFFLHILIPFLMFMGLTDLITVEGTENTMKSVICRPAERWKLYAAKLLAVLTYAAVYLLCVFILSAVLNQISSNPLGVSDLLTALASYALTLIPLAVLAAFAALVALFGKSGTLTMFILLLLYLLLSVLPVFFPILTQILFTSYLSWYRLWIGALPGAYNLIHALLAVLSYGTVFFLAGSLLYDRKEY
jgi:ABC-2 type transport system permease protein